MQTPAWHARGLTIDMRAVAGTALTPGTSAKEEKARVAAALQPPREPLSHEHLTNVDNIILTVLQKDQQRRVR